MPAADQPYDQHADTAPGSTLRERQHRYDSHRRDAGHAAAMAQGHAPMPGHMTTTDAWADHNHALQRANRCTAQPGWEQHRWEAVWQPNDKTARYVCGGCGVQR